MSDHSHAHGEANIHAVLRHAVAHFEHVLPGQAPIKDFVHHNTLHGFQHLPFAQALAEAHRLTGAYGYLPEEQFRDLYRAGRIDRTDLEHALDGDPELAAAEALFASRDGSVYRRDVYRVALVHGLKPLNGCQLTWQMDELGALREFQADVAADSRARLLRHAGGDSAAAIGALWQACLEVLGLEQYLMHPEELTDLSPEQAERMLAGLSAADGWGDDEAPGQTRVHRLMRRESAELLDHLLGRLGDDLTLRGLLLSLTGVDLLDDIRPQVVRHVGAWLDQGFAAWHGGERRDGFYAAWKRVATADLAWAFDDLPDWRDTLRDLPDDALEAVIQELRHLGLPEARWAGYLERLALELPGWSGMFLWRHNHPGYAGLTQVRVDMMDYLAVRLVLEGLFARRLARRYWQIEPSLDGLRWYFRRRRSELFVRHALFDTRRLPEYLATLGQRLGHRDTEMPAEYVRWQKLADMIWTWQHSPAADRTDSHTVYRSGWRLFRLAQHLGLCATEVRTIPPPRVEAIFACLDRLDPERSGFLWLQAYERHYREQLFNAVVNNHGRGRWAARERRPSAQVVFCMDDREEGIRRHLEELDPGVETLGAAGFFGVPINWRGLDDSAVSPLCPVVVQPAHEIRELAQTGHEATGQRHVQRRAQRLRLKDWLFQETRRNLLSGAATMAVAAPAALATLAAKVFTPVRQGRLSAALRRAADLDVPTRVTLTATSDTPATPEQPRLGFTDTEQADRVQGFLRTVGLQSGFAPYVVMMGHGSISQNNPHLAAYDCGACSGRHGGPNARVFAQMANRPAVRALLRARGLLIPDDTWFLGAEHNTCDESILWYDLEQVPEPLRQGLARLTADLDRATRGSAHERCRRFASAPDAPDLDQALHHVIGRSLDFSQARPELGHATNAAAFIGRRSLSQGAFFDRRVFLISYDPTEDPEGNVLEAILLAAGPVGAGISLEYYFSTVNNDRYGCGTKVTHNVVGLFGVMEGAGSDLRTGLPRQMIEIHEAMRLLIVVEHRPEILARIYGRQPVLQELVGNGWVVLATKDPDSPAIHLFKPGVGFEPWQGTVTPLPTVAGSPDWYRGRRDPLTPALIEPRAEVTHA